MIARAIGRLQWNVSARCFGADIWFGCSGEVKFKTD